MREDFTRRLPHAVRGSAVRLSVKSGNLDRDPRAELSIVVNETRDSRLLVATHFVFDDVNTGLRRLRAGPVQGLADGRRHTAVTADTTLGDLDNDGIDELIVAGLTRSPGNACDFTRYLLLAYDDLTRDLALFGHGAQYLEYYYPCHATEPSQVRTVYVHALDVDGDRRSEIVVNNLVFEDLTEQAPWTRVYQIPDEEIVGEPGDAATTFDRSTSALVVGDFTADGQDDIAIWQQWMGRVRVYSLNKQNGARWAINLVRTFEMENDLYEGAENPVLLAANVDHDSVRVRYTTGTHRAVFTEPLILAALAAPPCSDGIGQNLGACVTKFGRSQSSGSTETNALTVSVSTWVGVKAKSGDIFSVTAKAKMTESLKLWTSKAYQLKRTVIFTTGPAEDTVVFAALPVDLYEYEIVSHPDPDMIGVNAVVALPRSPIVLQTERSFYNENVLEGSPKVDHTVFQHTPRDRGSYMDPVQKNIFLRDRESLSIGPQSVGQGSGSTTLRLDVNESIGEGRQLSIGFQTDVEVTAGPVVAGFSVGVTASNALQVTSGESFSYTGVVGSIEAASFWDNQYSFGLFTYVHEDRVSERQWQVINYWVQ